MMMQRLDILKQLQSIQLGLKTVDLDMRHTAPVLLAQLQQKLDALVESLGSADPSALPISPTEAAKAFAERCKEFPAELIVNINEEIVQNYDLTRNCATINIASLRTTSKTNWLTLSALQVVYRTRGWNVWQGDCQGVFTFTKRDEKQAPSI
jgi:hypothetical protein